MIRTINKHLKLTVIIIGFAIFGELTLLNFIHSYLNLQHFPVLIDYLLDSIFVLIFVYPLIYYFYMARKLIIRSVTDPLTGIHNRAYFNGMYSELINKKEPFQLMLLDLCKFKEVNDTHGHEAGDLVLKVVAKRLAETVGNKGSVARLGGDEFVVLLTNITDNTAGAIANSVREPIFAEDGKELKISVSIGIADYPRTGTDLKTLMAKADCAMYNAKRNRIDIFVCHPGEGNCNLETPSRHKR
jgi:diguanylate cyclase (GGDEF)-like protein